MKYTNDYPLFVLSEVVVVVDDDSSPHTHTPVAAPLLRSGQHRLHLFGTNEQ
jgi:hypothetical protein